MITIYGLKNCDSCRKAIKWLDNNSFDYNFYDFKNFSLSDSLLLKWIEIQDLSNYDFLEGDYEIIQKIIKNDIKIY